MDAAANRLKTLAWSTATYRVIDIDHGPLWVVEASRGDQVIRCRAEVAAEAWTAAAELAERLG